MRLGPILPHVAMALVLGLGSGAAAAADSTNRPSIRSVPVQVIRGPAIEPFSNRIVRLIGPSSHAVAVRGGTVLIVRGAPGRLPSATPMGFAPPPLGFASTTLPTGNFVRGFDGGFDGRRFDGDFRGRHGHGIDGRGSAFRGTTTPSTSSAFAGRRGAFGGPAFGGVRSGFGGRRGFGGHGGRGHR